MTSAALLHVSLVYRAVEITKVPYNISLVFKLMTCDDQTNYNLLKPVNPSPSLTLILASLPLSLAQVFETVKFQIVGDGLHCLAFL